MNETAVDVFEYRIVRCQELLKTIEGHVEDHLGVSPDHVMWDTVGDARHLESELQKIVAWLTG